MVIVIPVRVGPSWSLLLIRSTCRYFRVSALALVPVQPHEGVGTDVSFFTVMLFVDAL